MQARDVIAIDYETALESGPASVEFFRPDFRVVSCAFSWVKPDGELDGLYVEGEENIRPLLQTLADTQAQVICHNFGFEYGVTLYRFPGIELNWYADTARMVQVADNGGKAFDDGMATLNSDIAGAPKIKKGGKVGMSLAASARRWLPERYHDHKAPYYEYLRLDHGVKKGQEGANLHLLPRDLLATYNLADTEVTLQLYYTLVRMFKDTGYKQWRLDHQLYFIAARKIAESRGQGILVDREALGSNLEALAAGIGKVSTDFRERFRDEIRALENDNMQKIVSPKKTERGRDNAWLRCVENPSLYEFKLSSGKQKEALFVGKLGLTPTYFTKKGAPAFSKAFLRQWGEGGIMLEKRGTMLLSQTQMSTLLDFSARDGRWHVDLSAIGTTTGRYKGRGGLNIQALARRDKALMGCLQADPGRVFVSCDLASGEPTVTTHFSRDPYYYQACFGMVGKAPYYDERGVLLIDDIYLMTMSVSPMGRVKMREVTQAFYPAKDGKRQLSFPEKWLDDKDYIQKRVLAGERAFHKILCLGLGYSMGPKHMVEAAFKAGYVITLDEAKAFFKAYWKLFAGVKKLGARLEKQYKDEGSLVNPFGYRLLPEPSYKALNYYIQSSVSGIINVLMAKFFAACPSARFVTVIHDEIVFDVPETDLALAKTIMQAAEDSLNKDLGWSVKVRCGWAEGVNMYEAK